MRLLIVVAAFLLSASCLAVATNNVDRTYKEAAELEKIFSQFAYGEESHLHARLERIELIHKYLNMFRAPVIDMPATPSPKEGARRPVVLMHGLGDAGSNEGMQSLAQSVTAKFPGTYAVAVDVADGLSSFFTLMDDQIDQFAATVRADPKLANGFNVLGLSQGGLVIRGYIERYNNPPVYNAISICGPQNGVGTCPGGTPGFICDFFKLGPYTAKLSFAGYWKEVADEQTYLKESTMLADLNNERDTKNSSYVEQLTSLNKYVLIMADNDTVVVPKESEQHGFWKWGDSTHSEVELIFDTQAYQQDWLGLATLNNTGRLDFNNFPGEHIRFTQEFWENSVLPYFDNSAEDQESVAPALNSALADEIAIN